MNEIAAPAARDGTKAATDGGLLQVEDLVMHFPIKSGIIIDHKYGRGIQLHFHWSVGSMTEKVAPRPGLLAAEIFPFSFG